MRGWQQLMQERRLPLLVGLLLCGIFIAANLVALTNGFYLLAVLPLGLLVVALAIWLPEFTFLLAVFLTPLSVEYSVEGSAAQLFSEPLIVLLMVLFLASLPKLAPRLQPLFRHPLTWLVVFHIGWMLITAFTSEMPLVSLKFFLARFWFVSVFFFFGAIIFQNPKRFRQFIWLYCLAFVVVIFYTLYQHQQHFWEQNYANYASIPFYINHGIYAAALAFFLPFLGILVVKPHAMRISRLQQLLALGLLVLFTIALIFSFTRAAWISVALAVGLLVLMLLRVRFWALMAGLLVFGVVVYAVEDDVRIYLEQNKTVSDSDFKAHLRSIYNISSDASNVERINRWKSAIRMWEERPVLGWGPNTYMFQYAPFQSAYERTVISTNWGTLGNAHSEYLGPLAEMGLPGMLSVIALLFAIVFYGMKLFYKAESPFIRYTAQGILLAMITYFSHGLLNNYLDMDKASVPFWAFLAMLTVMDLHERKLLQLKEEEAPAEHP